MCIEARIAWALLCSYGGDLLEKSEVLQILDDAEEWHCIEGPGTEGFFEEPAADDYGGMLERMEAEELLCLIERAKERLKELGGGDVGSKSEVRDGRNIDGRDAGRAGRDAGRACVKLYIDRRYSIRINAPDGPEMMLRPLVKALFILFLKHPEGILLKRRDEYREELEEIYGIIAPGVSRDDVIKRVGRLVCVEDNSFSEKASVLNASLERMLPENIVDGYKIQGHNGFPRKIPLAPVAAVWV